MERNFWRELEKNNGRCSYWKAFDGRKLDRYEKVIKSFIENLEYHHFYLVFGNSKKISMERLGRILPKLSPEVLHALTYSCILSGEFVPIQNIIVGAGKKNFSYEQRFAMWHGAFFKGVYAYGKPFVMEALMQKEPIVRDLVQKHAQMQTKFFCVKDVYAASIEQAKNSDTPSLWTSDSPAAVEFRKAALAQWPALEKAYKSLQKSVFVRTHHQANGLFETLCDEKTLQI